MTEPIIELDHISCQFDEKLAVRDVTLSILPGECLVLLGGSGSGKTTTLKTINRLVETTQGEVRVKGEPVHRKPPHLLRREIGYCFQRVGLFPHLTVAQNIGITPTLLKWSKKRIEARVRDLLHLVELEPKDYAQRMPDALSGGQQQRVGVARALAAEPQIVLFDEPFGALDPLTRDRLQESLIAIRKQVQMTAVFVTHDMTEAFLLSNRIAVMHEGSLLQVGTAQELIEKPAHGYVRELLQTPERQKEAVQALLGRSSAFRGAP